MKMKLQPFHIGKILCFFGALLLSQSLCAQSLTVNMFKSDISCAGASDGNAGADVSGGIEPYLYIWSNNAETATIGNLGPNTYTVTITDAAGNTITNGVNLPEVEPLEVVLIAEDGKCGKLGKVRAEVSGGIGPYFYDWSNGKFEPEIRDVEQGTYDVTVTDRGRCPVEKTAEVIVHGEGLDLSAVFELPSCSGDADGWISISQTGGEMPIEYMWVDGPSGTNRENLESGTYSISAVDAFGCVDGMEIILPDRELLAVEIINQNNSLFAKVEGGTPSYEYSWSNGVTGSSVISNLETGEYSLTVEDSRGCISFGFGDVLGPLSTNGISAIEQFSLYPTLVHSELFLQLELSSSESISAEIYSLDGQSQKRKESEGQNIQFQFSDLDKLNTGLYLVKISSTSGWSFSEKFIKR